MAAASEAAYQYVVVYDPEGGFVTGGGWINSPPGAYTPAPTLIGKATFGFNSKYRKGTTIPSGNTEFHFMVGGLGFKSTAYEWLVVSGTKAKFKGEGTINGSGNFGFMLSAIDGDLSNASKNDLFRIKIWDKVSGAVIYDNQPGELDTNDPTTKIQGGEITVHKP